MSPEEIERGLTHENPEVRLSFTNRTDFTPTREQIARALKDHHIVCNFLDRDDVILNQTEFEAALTSPDWFIRMVLAQREEYPLTPEQVERGLNDYDINVVIAYLERKDIQLTPAQIERGLTEDVYLQLTTSFIKHTSYTPTPEQFERGLTHSRPFIRKTFAKREDFLPDQQQLERGLIDKEPEVRAVFEERKDEWLSQLHAALLHQKFNSTPSPRKVL
jgi:hypothetical protein